MPLLMALAIRWIPSSLLEECRKDILQIPSEPLKKRWIYAIPFVLTWLLILAWIVSIILAH